MNNFKTTLCIFAAMALAAFALPSVAGNDKKQFSLTMSSPADQTPPPYTVQAMIANEGNSTINSFQLSYSGRLAIVGVVQPPSGNATFTANSVTFKNLHPIKSGAPLTVTIDVSTCAGDNAGTWSGTAWTGSQLNGQSFNLGADSVLTTPVSCGTAPAGGEIDVLDSQNPASCVSGQRGFYDKDGVVRSGVQYFVTNNVFTYTPQLHFAWPDGGIGTGIDSAATFEYDVCAPDPLPAPGTTQVAWLNTDGSSASTPGTPAFITAQPCDPKANFLPAPYGTLVSDNGSYITVDTLTPDPELLHGSVSHAAPPFDIVIGSERMTVLFIGDNDGDPGDLGESGEGEGPRDWTVIRHVGGTTQAVHTAGHLVMSTPLPLLPLPGPVQCFDGAGTSLSDSSCHYVAGNQALMCIHVPATEELPPATGTHATTFIDIGGDGWGSHP